jgi:NagD protein
VEASTGRRPDRIIGKPFVGIVEGALRIAGAAADEAAMAGDRLYTDVAAGVNAGLLSILVLTGEASRKDIDSSDIRPHLIFDRLSAMIPELLRDIM